MSGSSAIEMREIVKHFGKTPALRGLSLTVPSGSICGFLGRNGAGKTTAIKILLNMVRAESGHAHVLGLDGADPQQSIIIRQRSAYVSDSKELYPYMTAAELIRFTRSFFPKWRTDLEADYARRLAVPLDRKLGKLSRGTKTNVMLLLALCRGAELLLLDEPTEGLDPVAREELLQMLASLTAESGATVFFSSHDLSEVEQIADRVCIIDEGRTLVEDCLDDLRDQYRRVRVVFAGEPARELVSWPGLQQARVDGPVLSGLLTRDAEHFAAQARGGSGVRSVDLQHVTLKEIFFNSIARQQS